MAIGKRGSGPSGGVSGETPGRGADSGTASGESRRQKRAAPTIDLTATEVKPEEPTPAPELQPESQPSKPANRAGIPNESASRQSAASGPRPAPAFTLRNALSASTIAAGLIGALLVSLVLFVFWLTGMVPIRYAGTTAMRARVSVLEMQVNDLTNRVAPNGGLSQKTAEDIAQRLAKLEQEQSKAVTAAAADPKLIQRLEAAENAMKALGVALAGINGRVEANAARVEASEKAAVDATRATATSDGALANRVETLEQTTAAATKKLAATTADERAARLAVAASALRDAVNAGEPFPAELAAAKSLGADNTSLGMLESFAASGVPRDSALARELSALLPAIQKAAGTDAPASGGFLDKLQANASKLVRVRPAGDVAGSDTAAIAARLENKAAKGDIAGAVAELKALPEAVRAPAQGWIAKVEARRAAVEASRKLAADSLRALQ
jgi:hypothetical protein